MQCFDQHTMSHSSARLVQVCFWCSAVCCIPASRWLTQWWPKRFMWRNINKQITEWARSCIPCQQLKIARHCNISRCCSTVSTPSMLILSDRCYHLRVFHTCSLSWTDSRGGQKPSLSQTSWPSLVHHMMVYHLQANGLVEHFHRHLKAALKARLKDAN